MLVEPHPRSKERVQGTGDDIRVLGGGVEQLLRSNPDLVVNKETFDDLALEIDFVDGFQYIPSVILIGGEDCWH